jgi:hypothetical protein
LLNPTTFFFAVVAAGVNLTEQTSNRKWADMEDCVGGGGDDGSDLIYKKIG